MTRRTQTKSKRNEPPPPRRTAVDQALLPQPMPQVWCELGDHNVAKVHSVMSAIGITSCEYHANLTRLHQDAINTGVNKILFDGQAVGHVYTRDQLAHLLALYHTDIVTMTKEIIK